MKYSVKKGKNAKGNTWYQYTGTLKDGKTFTGKKYSSEQSARNDVNKQQYSHMAKGNIFSKFGKLFEFLKKISELTYFRSELTSDLRYCNVPNE